MEVEFDSSKGKSKLVFPWRFVKGLSKGNVQRHILRWNTSIFSFDLLGAKLEMPVHGLVFLVVTEPDMGDAVA